MNRTTNLRRQHDSVLALIQEITRLADRAADPDTAFQAGMKLARLTGVLQIHFAQEDRNLYPEMIASKNPEAVSAAMRYQTEMGDLSKKFEAFAGRWSSGKTISDDALTFQRESRSVLDILVKRIERENSILYPIADAIA